MEIQDQHDVRIECEPNIGYVVISGLARNVAIAAGNIHKIIHDWEREKHHTDVTVREVWLLHLRYKKSLHSIGNTADQWGQWIVLLFERGQSLKITQSRNSKKTNPLESNITLIPYAFILSWMVLLWGW